MKSPDGRNFDFLVWSIKHSWIEKLFDSIFAARFGGKFFHLRQLEILLKTFVKEPIFKLEIDLSFQTKRNLKALIFNGIFQLFDLKSDFES